MIEKLSPLTCEQDWKDLVKSGKYFSYYSDGPTHYPCVPIYKDGLDFVYLTDFNSVPVNNK